MLPFGSINDEVINKILYFATQLAKSLP